MSRFSIIAFAFDLSIIVGRPVTIDEARAVRRDLTAHHTIQEQWCSEEMSDARVKRVKARETGVERRLTEFFGDALKEFTGDPRGATVKLHHVQTMEAFAYFGGDWGGNFVFTGYKS